MVAAMVATMATDTVVAIASIEQLKVASVFAHNGQSH